MTILVLMNEDGLSSTFQETLKLLSILVSTSNYSHDDGWSGEMFFYVKKNKNIFKKYHEGGKT